MGRTNARATGAKSHSPSGQARTEPASGAYAVLTPPGSNTQPTPAGAFFSRPTADLATGTRHPARFAIRPAV
jgi:hypothetical protein